MLGAIVFFIAVRLIDLRSLRDIQRESPGEYALAFFAAASVVLVGVEQGMLLAWCCRFFGLCGIAIVRTPGSWSLASEKRGSRKYWLAYGAWVAPSRVRTKRCPNGLESGCFYLSLAKMRKFALWLREITF